MKAAVSGEMTDLGQESGPVVYLLVGLTGSGKTTYAKLRLVPTGAVRLSVDERVHARYGRYGVDYPEREYFALEAPVVAEVREELVDLIAAGRDVVLDHGLWLRSDREEWKKLVIEAGGRPRLLYFPVPRTELLRRLDERNQREDGNALTVTESALNDFYARFEPPHDEGEDIVEPDSF
ncbi:ATP-binding protein [Streptomyces mirabilis]|uniref:AAA family ATPase n=1 Tax=Streptomyces mirabilis TaxID=68239 RepID=UPI00225394F4|nr:ATP-binding protein [Streptomyces mirabilis]MCX4617969.1 ATP-binding protein [Streptomyces mirabilis]